MALVDSLDIPLGTSMPEFNLKDPDGKIFSRDALMGEKGLLIVFTCNHCPYAVAIWPEFVSLAREAMALKVSTVAINPNIHPDYPEDAPEKMKEKAKEWGTGFPYLVDDTQAVARSFKAQCTPDIYLLNAESQLVYHGEFKTLKAAIADLAAGRPISPNPRPSMGCSIKWQKG